jgi:hypothetical protein
MFWVVRENNLEEYLPALKTHLRSIVANPDLHHWKLNDFAALLMKFDSDFVRQQFALYGLDLDRYSRRVDARVLRQTLLYRDGRPGG